MSRVIADGLSDKDLVELKYGALQDKPCLFLELW